MRDGTPFGSYQSRLQQLCDSVTEYHWHQRWDAAECSVQNKRYPRLERFADYTATATCRVYTNRSSARCSLGMKRYTSEDNVQ